MGLARHRNVLGTAHLMGHFVSAMVSSGPNRRVTAAPPDRAARTSGVWQQCGSRHRCYRWTTVTTRAFALCLLIPMMLHRTPGRLPGHDNDAVSNCCVRTTANMRKQASRGGGICNRRFHRFCSAAKVIDSSGPGDFSPGQRLFDDGSIRLKPGWQLRARPSSISGSSIVNPGVSVAISNSTPPGSRK